MKILGLDHIVLRCGDLGRMSAFYTSVLGCSIEKRVDRLGLIHLRAGASLIDLISAEGELGRVGGPPPGIEARNMDHLCLRVEAFDIGALRQHFAAHAVELISVQQNFGAEGDGPSVYFKDPEANTIEIKGPSSSAQSNGHH